MNAAHPSDGQASRPAAPPAGAAFLLAQLGAHAAGLFAQRVAVLDLTPAQSGVLRLVALKPGRSQQALADQLGVLPSKIVSLVDGLEDRGLLERRRGTSDRRHYALHLTERGTQTLADIREVAVHHEDDITAALNDAERRKLIQLLQRIADQQGLEPGVHPGYRNLGGGARPREATDA